MLCTWSRAGYICYVHDPGRVIYVMYMVQGGLYMLCTWSRAGYICT